MHLATLEAIPVRLPYRAAFATSRGPIGDPLAGGEHVVVKAVADDGTVGWGECRPPRHWSEETPETVVSTINRYWSPALRGLDVADQERLDQLLSGEIAPGYTLGQPIARCGVELALWDLLGKSLGVPVQHLLGGLTQRSITLSWTVVGASPEAAAASLEEGRRAGYRHFNYKVGADVGRDVEVGRTIRALAPEAFVWADANGGYSLAAALVAVRRLADVGVDLLEAPVPPNRLTDYPRLRRAAGLPIGLDEGLCDPIDLIQLLRLEALDVFVIKLARMGGLRRSRQALEIARAAGLEIVCSGLTEADLVLAASAHLCAAYGVTAPCALNGRQFLGDRLAEGLASEGDQVLVPTTPGLGVTVDETRLADLRQPLAWDPV